MTAVTAVTATTGGRATGGGAPDGGPHGGDGRVVARRLGLDPDAVLDLSASLNPFAPDVAPVVAAHLAGGALGRYPDADDEAAATEALAGALGVAPARVLLTNGGSEAVALVAAELGRGWVDEPDFSLYRRHLGAVEPGAPRFRSDPHNPTGRLAPDHQTAAVWDEAFYPLATGRWSRLCGADPAGPGPSGRDRPAVVLGSLTKVLACPGLRVGWVVVPGDDGAALGVPGLAGRLAARRPRWSVATPALAALPELLAACDLPAWAARVAAARADLVRVLEDHGLAPRDSDANFVLVDGADGLRGRLAVHGVVVRDGAGFGLPGSVRIAVPDERGLARLEAALAAVT